MRATESALRDTTLIFASLPAFTACVWLNMVRKQMRAFYQRPSLHSLIIALLPACISGCMAKFECVYRRVHFISAVRNMQTCNKLKSMGQNILLSVCVQFILQLHPKKPLTVKNYGVWIRYDSRSGTHNMYKEYRDLTEEGAVTQLYREMGARHRARATSIQVIKVEVVPDAKCRRSHVTQFHGKDIKFPLPHRIARSLHAPRFTTSRPLTTF